MSNNSIPTRELGNTGEEVSILGIGGYHIGKLSEDRSISLIRRAIEKGITFMDNAWCYHQGLSEEIMGRALEDGYRDRVFLMTKNHGRTKQRFNKQLEESLKRLKTDCIDLLQLHEIVNRGEPARIKKEAVLEEALEARREGKIKYIGFTGHRFPALHQEILEFDFDWDSVQIPVNIFDYHYRSFQNQIIPQARQKNMGIIGMKNLASSRLLDTDIDPEEAIRYSLSMPISTLVSGIDSFEVLEKNVQIARDFEPFSQNELQEIREKYRDISYRGEHEYYKND